MQHLDDARVGYLDDTWRRGSQDDAEMLRDVPPLGAPTINVGLGQELHDIARDVGAIVDAGDTNDPRQQLIQHPAGD